MINLIAFIVAFAVTFILMPSFISYFTRKKLGQTTREEGPTWHAVKTGTPTMGGTVFVGVSIIMTIIVASLGHLWSPGLITFVLTLTLFGGIGFVDDFISIFRKQNEGLTAKQKFILQLVFSGLVMGIGYLFQDQYRISLFSWSTDHWALVIPFAFIWITGFSNAVNLTDGLDGLATGLNIIAYSTYFYLSLQADQAPLALACMVVVASLLAFLFYNHKPAKIFMGDVGSLALGAGLAVLSILLNNPWVLLLIGIVFVIETASVMIQVTSFKLTGKRVFKMSPIHHHFEMSGWSEEKVVMVFWLVGLLASLLTFVL